MCFALYQGTNLLHVDYKIHWTKQTCGTSALLSYWEVHTWNVLSNLPIPPEWWLWEACGASDYLKCSP